MALYLQYNQCIISLARYKSEAMSIKQPSLLKYSKNIIILKLVTFTTLTIPGLVTLASSVNAQVGHPCNTDADCLGNTFCG